MKIRFFITNFLAAQRRVKLSVGHAPLHAARYYQYLRRRKSSWKVYWQRMRKSKTSIRHTHKIMWPRRRRTQLRGYYSPSSNDTEACSTSHYSTSWSFWKEAVGALRVITLRAEAIQQLLYELLLYGLKLLEGSSLSSASYLITTQPINILSQWHDNKSFN